jgi:hypothetical protein
VARQERVVAATERKVAEAAAAEAQRDPDRWVDQYSGELVECVRIEAELGERFTAAYERALRSVRMNPTRGLTDWLGACPRSGIDRELWERQAVRLELHRARHGEFPDRSDALRQLLPADWRTAPRELAHTAPDRPELPAAGRVPPEIGDTGPDLGP